MANETRIPEDALASLRQIRDHGPIASGDFGHLVVGGYCTAAPHLITKRGLRALEFVDDGPRELPRKVTGCPYKGLCAEEGDRLDQVRAALHTYHRALDSREHGDVAANKFVHAVEDILGVRRGN